MYPGDGADPPADDESDSCREDCGCRNESTGWDPWVQSLMDRMGADAERVADGDISEREFHEKYHEERRTLAEQFNPTDDMPPVDPAHPEWEEWANERLSDVDYDTEFGIELARDARFVAEGRLSAEEFHKKHHEETVAEFGVDERPTKSTVEPAYTPPANGPPQPSVPGTGGEPSRRSFMRAAGAAGAVALGASGVHQAGEAAAAATSTVNPDEPDRQLGMAIDTERCIACLQCMDGCNEENGTAAESLWMYVFRYTEDDYTNESHWLTRPCQHCTNAPCVNACPTASRYKRSEDGIVLTDYDTCTGCRYCEVACPYGVNYLAWLGGGGDHQFEGDRTVDGRPAAGNPPRGVMGKCTFCAHRQVSGDPELEDTTACEDVCPVDAIHFGDLTDADSDPRQHIEEKRESSTFRLLEDTGTEPNVIYIGNEPSVSAEPVQGPASLDDFDLRKGRPGRTAVTVDYVENPTGGG